MLPTDSSEYEILASAAIAIRGLEPTALTCEIGLRAGGGSRHIIEALVESEQRYRTHIAIDPYGNIEYETSEGLVTRHDYTNHMRNQCMQELYQYATEKDINVLVFLLEDTEFFNRFSDGVPIYQEVKRLATHYALVHFDGPHAKEPLQKEIDFFVPRIIHGGMFVFDDINNYNHQEVEEALLPRGFELVERGSNKASYRHVGL